MEASKAKLASCKTEEERAKMMFVIYKELTDRVESVSISLSLRSLGIGIPGIQAEGLAKNGSGVMLICCVVCSGYVPFISLFSTLLVS